MFAYREYGCRRFAVTLRNLIGARIIVMHQIEQQLSDARMARMFGQPTHLLGSAVPVPGIVLG